MLFFLSLGIFIGWEASVYAFDQLLPLRLGNYIARIFSDLYIAKAVHVVRLKLVEKKESWNENHDEKKMTSAILTKWVVAPFFHFCEGMLTWMSGEIFNWETAKKMAMELGNHRLSLQREHLSDLEQNYRLEISVVNGHVKYAIVRVGEKEGGGDEK